MIAALRCRWAIGCCGAALVHDGRERMMRCPACGNLIYPRISPSVIAGVCDGDRILIDIPQRGINLLVDDAELARRRSEQDAKGWKPAEARPRKVSTALKAYALLATSADKGAVRDKALLDG